ncbi:uncharacterized protein BT62DRAFT_147991 [Guyanagaster necrorhizus]|uniref:F-box domain-containing protein n=1 Tax=Guyanagaster necrorhizus TaxID=856835 RepID=A0A9P8ATL8_9AGAR|nr:uncharacterized protein BT62DRAFT_147991 [Guyanagaster necrorhizus MCA 3950]KAG7446017.1 hypothetical protein BT62DRAFT_147991 [Guyanagaster necrorhizus MCA 3950]
MGDEREKISKMNPCLDGDANPLRYMFVPASLDFIKPQALYQKIPTVQCVTEDGTVQFDLGLHVDVKCSKDQKCISAPIQRIPPELLMEVFLWARAQYDTLDLADEHSLPWTLSQVCSSWRATTMSLPEIWTDFTLNSSRLIWKRQPLSLLTAVATRCRHTLNFTWKDLAIDAGSDGDYLLKALFQVLINHSDSWKVVQLELPCHLIPMLSQLHGRLSSLTDLHFSCYSSSVDNIEGFEVAPRLTNIKIRGLGPYTRFAFPWKNLVHYCDHRIPEGRAFDLGILNKAPYLEAFESNVRQQILSMLTPVFHDRLSLLNVRDSSFLDSLTLPALKEITLRPYIVDETRADTNLPALLGMISRSKCSLRRLSVYDVAPDSDLIHILEMSPELEFLSLNIPRCRDPSSVHLRSLMSHMQGALVSRLGTLAINRYDRDTSEALVFLDEVFVEMIAGRHAKRSLHAVRFDVWVPEAGSYKCPLSEGSVRRLKEFQGEGLELCIRANDFGTSKRYV